MTTTTESPPAPGKRGRLPDAEGGDLFGYPPRRAVTCRRCGLSAEPYGDREGRTCWLCQALAENAAVARG